MELCAATEGNNFVLESLPSMQHVLFHQRENMYEILLCLCPRCFSSHIYLYVSINRSFQHIDGYLVANISTGVSQ